MGSIATLDCAGAAITGELIEDEAAVGVSADIDYTGGDGSAHPGQVVPSTNILGLTATLLAGNFNVGVGTLVYDITGIPDSAGGVSFSGNSFSVAAQDGSPLGHSFSPDGLKMFMVGSTSDSIYEYDLPSAFSLVGASFSGNSFSIAAQDATPHGLDFSPDGLKMFVVGSISDAIYEYDLISPFSLVGASFSGNSFSVAAQDNLPLDLSFSTNGLKMFMVGGTSSVYEYDLPSAFSLVGASFSGNSFSVAAQDATPHGLEFSPDGLKMFMVGSTSDAVYEYDLPTAFSLIGVIFSGNSFSIGAQDTGPHALSFSANGLKMFMMGSTSDSVHEYNLESSFSLIGGARFAIEIGENVSFSGNSFNVSAQENIPQDVAFSTDGLKMFVVGNGTDSIYEYNLPSSFSLIGASFSGNSFSVGSQDGAPTDLAFSPDGLKMFMVGASGDRVYEYDLISPFSMAIGNVSYSGNLFSISAQENLPSALEFSPDGLKMFVMGNGTSSVYEYDLPSAFSLIGASFSGNSFSFLAQDATPRGMHFPPDGLKMFMVGVNTDSIYEYDLPNAFSLVGASFSGNSFSIAAQDTGSSGLAFSPNGLKMFMIGSSSDTVFEYDLITAFSLGGVQCTLIIPVSAAPPPPPDKIMARSPFYVTATGASTINSAELRVRIWAGDRITDRPVTQNFKINKDSLRPGIDTDITFEIAQLIRDFFDHENDAYTDLPSSFVDVLWVETELDVVQEDDPQPTTETKQFLAFDGYGYPKDLVNFPGDLIMINIINVNEGDDTRIPVYAELGGVDQVVFSDPGGIVADIDLSANVASLKSFDKLVYLTQAGIEINKIELFQAAGLLETIVVNQICEPKYIPAVVKFYDKMGALQILFMFKVRRSGIEIQKQKYQANIGTTVNNKFQFDPSKHQVRDFNITSNENQILNSGFVGEDQNEVFKQLLNSEQVWIDDVPVSPTSLSFRFQTKLNERLINNVVTFDVAQNAINNIQ